MTSTALRNLKLQIAVSIHLRCTSKIKPLFYYSLAQT